MSFNIQLIYVSTAYVVLKKNKRKHKQQKIDFNKLKEWMIIKILVNWWVERAVCFLISDHVESALE